MTTTEELERARSFLYQTKHKEAEKILNRFIDDRADKPVRLEAEVLRITSLNGFAGRCQFKEVIKKVDHFLVKPGVTEFPQFIVDALLEKIEAQYWLGQYDEMYNTISKINDNIPKITDSAVRDRRKGMMHFWKGYVSWVKYGFTDVRSSFDESEKLLKDTNYTLGLAMVNIALGVLENISGNVDAAVERFTRSMSFYDRLEHVVGSAWAKNYYGIAERTKGNYDKAIRIHHETLRVLEPLEHLPMISFNLNSLGFDYQAMGSPEKALEFHDRSLEVRRKLKVSPLIAESLQALAETYEQLRQFDAALDYARQHLEIRKQSENKTLIAFALLQVGKIQTKLGRLHDAQETNKEALKKFETINNEVGISFAHNQLGTVYVLLGKLDESLNHLQKAINIQELNSMPFALSDSYAKIAQVYYERAAFSKAEEFLNKSIKIREEHPNWVEQISKPYYNMFKVKTIQGNEKEAEKYLNKMGKLFKETRSPVIEQHYNLAKSMYLRENGSKSEREEIINNLRHTHYQGRMDYELRTDLDIILSNILIQDMVKDEEEEPVLAEVRTYINNLEGIRKQEKSELLYAETLSLQGLLAKAEHKPEMSKNYFSKAVETVEQNKLDRVAWTYKLKSDNMP